MRFRHTLPLLYALLALAPAPALAQTYVEFFELPGNPPLHGLDYHDGFLWVAVSSSAQPRLHRIDPSSGSVLTTLVVGGSFTPLGVTWDGANFRLSETFTSSPDVFTLSPAGAIRGQIPAPSPLSNGLALHDGTLFVAKAYPDDEAAIVGVDPATGDVTETIPFPSTQPGGIAFLSDGTFWTTNVGDDSGSDIAVLWRIDRATGTVLDTLEVPTGASRPRGLAYDGSRFLYAVMAEPGGFDDVIYKIDLLDKGTPVYADDVDALDWGIAGDEEPSARSFTISNEGDANLEIGDPTVTGPDASLFTPTFSARTVTPVEDFSATVLLSSTGEGPREATLVFPTNDAANPLVEIPLRAFGIVPHSYLGIIEQAHDFGEVRIENPYGDWQSTLYWQLQLFNGGKQLLTITDIEVDDPAFSVVNIAPPVSIASTDTLSVLVAFAPDAVGPYEATLTITSDAFEQPSQTATLTGEGIDPDINGGDALWTLIVPDNPTTSSDELRVSHLAPIGDITGDGKADLIVGAANSLVFAVNGNSWGTGDVLWTFNTCTDDLNCGAISGVNGRYETALETAHDLNGDGTPDVLFSTEGGNDHVYALDGRDGTILWEVGSDTDPFLAPYYSVSARYDVTGDGVVDVVTGTGSASDQSPDPFNDRRVYGLDGATGAQLWERQPGGPSFVIEQIRLADGTVLAVAGNPSFAGGSITAWTADDGTLAWTLDPAGLIPFVFAPYPRDDGGEDLIYTGFDGIEEEGLLFRLDGMTGDIVWAQFGYGGSVALAVTDDLNGNGSADVIVDFFSFGSTTVALDGADGSEIWSTNEAGGQGLAALRDVTGDGISDIAAATLDGRALLLSGADGSIVWSYAIGNGTFDQAAEVVAVIPDIDGNGAPEIAVGARQGRLALLASTGAVLTASDDDAVPTAFALDGGYPNPFREQTTLGYTLPDAADVRLTVYDVLGRRLRTLVAETQAAGTYTVVWDGRSAAGAPAASGVYLVRLEAGRSAATRRLVLVR